jgi:hypothetical protein
MFIVPIEVPRVALWTDDSPQMLVPLDIYCDVLVKVIEKIF